MEWPKWWNWELVFTGHLEARMEERGFSEVELRRMLDVAQNFHPSEAPGRWVIETRHRNRDWAVIVEPDEDDQVLVIVSAYPTNLT